MSSLTKLAALRMQLAELERTSCARCTHPLGQHRMTTHGAECRVHILVPGRRSTEFCSCPDFCDSLDEQLSLEGGEK